MCSCKHMRADMRMKVYVPTQSLRVYSFTRAAWIRLNETHTHTHTHTYIYIYMRRQFAVFAAPSPTDWTSTVAPISIFARACALSRGRVHARARAVIRRNASDTAVARTQTRERVFGCACVRRLHARGPLALALSFDCGARASAERAPRPEQIA